MKRQLELRHPFLESGQHPSCIICQLKGHQEDHEQVLLIGSESALAQADQLLLSGGRILDGSDLDPQNVLVAGPIRTHSADDVMITEALPIDVDRR